MTDNEDYIEDDIYKLSLKKLKELALRRNINPKLKKAQLVNALLSTGEFIPQDKSELIEHNMIGRLTRSRASVLKSIDTATNSKNETNLFSSANEASSTTQKKRKTKTKKGLTCENNEGYLNSSLSKNGTPLFEITNTDKLSDSEFQRRDNLNQENKLTKKEEDSKMEVTHPCNLENDFASANSNNNKKISSKKRGRKNKKAQELNTNLGIGVTINSDEGEINVDKKIVEIENLGKSKCSQDESSDISNFGSRNPKRSSRIGKEENLVESLSTKKYINLNSENKSSPQGNISASSVSPNASECVTIANNRTSSASKIAGTVHLNSTNKGCKTTTEPEVKEELAKSPGEMPVLAPVRSSTFVLENKDAVSKDIHFSLPKRSDTFIISDDDSKQRKNVNTTNKSIGARILSSSIKLGGTKSARNRQGQGSSVKKTITKTTTTPGAVSKSKFSGPRKAPNFKTIHKKLFNNMESLSDNKKRVLERAKALTQSPVPKCAIQSPNWEPKVKNNNIVKSGISHKTPTRNSPTLAKSKTPAVDRSVPTQTLAKSKTPAVDRSVPTPTLAKSKTPAVDRSVPTPTLAKSKTPAVERSVPSKAPKSASINRFGFHKTRINKEVASSIVGSKLPQINIERKKDEDRALIQGVRMNKRFMLQMKMRHNMQ